LENSRVLACTEVGQQNDRAIREFESIVVCVWLSFVNLPETGDRPAELAKPGPRQQPAQQALPHSFSFEGEFSAGQ
jgi:hypothetical protein